MKDTTGRTGKRLDKYISTQIYFLLITIKTKNNVILILQTQFIQINVSLTYIYILYTNKIHISA